MKGRLKIKSIDETKGLSLEWPTFRMFIIKCGNIFFACYIITLTNSVEALLFYTCSVVMFESVVLCFSPKYLYIPWNFSFFLSFLLLSCTTDLLLYGCFLLFHTIQKSDVSVDYYIRKYLYKHARNVVVSMTECMWFGFGQLIIL